MNKEKNIETFYPETKAQWREWLIENHEAKPAVWLLQFKKSSGKPGITWSEAVEEALCFGWIDSIRKTLDEERFIQFFSKRKPKSAWSKINKDKIKQLINAELMFEAGLNSIETAKNNGSWFILDEVEELQIPADLAIAFKKNKGSEKYFLSLSKSNRKAILQWVTLAKKTETRQSRISEVAQLAAGMMKPKHLRTARDKSE